MAARKCSLGRIGKYWLNISISFLLSEQLVLLNELSRKVLSGFKLVQTKIWEKNMLQKTAFHGQQVLKNPPFLAVLFIALTVKSS